MKKLLGTEIEGTYTFNAASNTVTFSGVSQTLTLANILLITNVTDNVIIYNFADSTAGVASFSNNVLTLTYDTTSMSDSDVLQIYVDVESYEESLHTLLRRMNKLLESNAVVDSNSRQRIAVETMPSITVGSAPTTAVTNTTGIGGSNSINALSNPYALASNPIQYVALGPVDQRWMIVDAARAAYGTSIRTNLIFS